MNKKTALSFTPLGLHPIMEQSIKEIQEEAKSKKATLGLLSSREEMDLAGSTFSRAMKNARKKSEHLDTKILRGTSSVFVPIIFCIKTQKTENEPAEQLLASIINLLYRNGGNYLSETHNLLYTFAEFCIHILYLTQTISPPPLSELLIPICNKDIIFYEGVIGDIPNERDNAVAQLCSLLPSETIVLLWEALLLDYRIVLYTADANYFFFIAKALTQLMFPLVWPFSKGIAPSLPLLSSINPYFFGNLLKKI